tara:strand:+ start:45 stop:149 length:105 start_codon:yes stop_codon:yes gene_type:complete
MKSDELFKLAAEGLFLFVAGYLGWHVIVAMTPIH